MEALSYSMATRREKCIPGLPLEISWLVERVRKRRFYNNFFCSAELPATNLIKKPFSLLHVPLHMLVCVLRLKRGIETAQILVPLLKLEIDVLILPSISMLINQECDPYRFRTSFPMSDLVSSCVSLILDSKKLFPVILPPIFEALIGDDFSATPAIVFCPIHGSLWIFLCILKKLVPIPIEQVA